MEPVEKKPKRIIIVGDAGTGIKSLAIQHAANKIEIVDIKPVKPHTSCGKIDLYTIPDSELILKTTKRNKRKGWQRPYKFHK